MRTNTHPATMGQTTPLLFCLLALLTSTPSSAFHYSSSLLHKNSKISFSKKNRGRNPHGKSSNNRNAIMEMRDRSSAYWFSVGDSVKVVDDVQKGGFNLRNKIGVVEETWEKCDVDPTCCCAEQVDLNMAVRVKFEEHDDEEVVSTLGDTFTQYFAEEELIKVKEEKNVAFDGLSCKAFKLQQLQGGEQAKRLALFAEASTLEKENL